MNIEDAKKIFVFSTKIELNVNGSEEFVELREMNSSEMHQIMVAAKMDKNMDFTDIVSMLEQAEKILPQCVVDSSFTASDGRPATGKEVYELLKLNAQTMNHVLTQWLNQGDGATPFGLAGGNGKN